MKDNVIVEFHNMADNSVTEIETPASITANDLVLALNDAFSLGMDTDNIFSCYLVSENPIAFLRGNKMLQEFGIHNGTQIIFPEKQVENNK